MIDVTDPKDHKRLVEQLTGPLRTVGGGLSPDEMQAPSWWHGDEDAFESAQAAMMTLPSRGRARR